MLLYFWLVKANQNPFYNRAFARCRTVYRLYRLAFANNENIIPLSYRRVNKKPVFSTKLAQANFVLTIREKLVYKSFIARFISLSVFYPYSAVA